MLRKKYFKAFEGKLFKPLSVKGKNIRCLVVDKTSVGVETLDYSDFDYRREEISEAEFKKAISKIQVKIRKGLAK